MNLSSAIIAKRRQIIGLDELLIYQLKRHGLPLVVDSVPRQSAKDHKAEGIV